jgi:hypothetical protein
MGQVEAQISHVKGCGVKDYYNKKQAEVGTFST